MPSYAITGASRGIGFEFVRQLSTVQENVVFAIIRNRNTATNLEQLNRPNVHVLIADVVDHVALKAAAQEASKITGGKLDVLINNAAYIQTGGLDLTLDTYPEGAEDALEADLKNAFNTNVIGVVHATNAFLPMLRAGTIKKVITISSGAGDIDTTLQSGFAISAPYSISKAAVNMAVAKYAVKFKSEGFVFLALHPGWVDTYLGSPTPQQIEGFKKIGALFKKAYPGLKGPITPETSVRMQLQVIDKSTVEDTGAFISHHGNKEWF